jgi:hypothetical protein
MEADLGVTIEAVLSDDGRHDKIIASFPVLGDPRTMDSPEVELGAYRWRVSIREYGRTNFIELQNLSKHPAVVSLTTSAVYGSGDIALEEYSQKDKITGFGACIRFLPRNKNTLPRFVGTEDGTVLENALVVTVIISSCATAALITAPPPTCLSDSNYVYPNPNRETQGTLLTIYDAETIPTDFTLSLTGGNTRSIGEKRTHDAMEQGASAAGTPVTIAAHKLILAARSPVFRTMFQAPMREASISTMEIADFSELVVREFVRFLYSDRCPRSVLSEHAEELLAIAGKYEVPALMTVCEHYLVGTVCVGNAIALLSFADTHNAAALRASALDYVRENARSFVTSMEDVPAVSGEIFKELMKAMAKGSRQGK